MLNFLRTLLLSAFVFLQRQVDKWPNTSGLSMNGNWRVRYRKHGYYSRRMTYKEARSCAALFNGDLLWVRHFDPLENPA